MKKNDEKAKIEYLSIEKMMPHIQEQLACGGSVELPVRGRSMRPFLKEGSDSVILRAPDRPLQKYDVPLYQRPDGSYVLHRIVAIGKRSYICMGDAQLVQEYGISLGRIIAYMTAVRRGDRLIDVRSQKHLFCVKAWHYSRLLRRFLWRVKRKIIKTLNKT